jgi:hypothetical protein
MFSVAHPRRREEGCQPTCVAPCLEILFQPSSADSPERSRLVQPEGCSLRLHSLPSTAILSALLLVAPACTSHGGVSPDQDGSARDQGARLTGQSCPCLTGSRCWSSGAPTYWAICDSGGWLGDVLFVSDDHSGQPLSFSPSAAPCPATEVQTGDRCLNSGLVCGYASAGCSGTLRWYACEYAADHGEWHPVADLCPILCPTLMPHDGAACLVESTFCHYQSDCGAAIEAACLNGTWSVTNYPCACADPNRYHTGTPCASPDVVCQDRYPTLVWTSTCSDGQWQAVYGNASCPPEEPAANDPCQDGDVCTWINACADSTQGTCTGSVWQKNASPCPGSRLPSCNPGDACEARTSCSSPCEYTNQPFYSCQCASDGTLACETLYCPCFVCAV